MKLVTSLITILSLTSLLSAESVKVEDHVYPKKVDAAGASWELQGTEHFRYKVIFSVFTSAYYREIKGEGQRLKFTYTRNLKAKDLREQAMKTLEAQHSPDTLETYEELTEQIQSAYIDVKDGDAYTITVLPEKGTWLHLNDKELFFTKNAEFGVWYLGIWLGENPINDSLKAALLQQD